MRSGFRQCNNMNIRTLRRTRWLSRTLIALAAATWLLSEFALPWSVYWWHRDEYLRLVVECDLAMHDEVSIRDADLPREEAAALRVSGDVGLLVCHEYDTLRKQLLIAGVSEHRLALLGLEGLELERIPVSRMVEPHRMPRF
jgi:hypothetical protein